MSDRMGAAEYLLNDPLLKDIFDQLETDALESAIWAKQDDDEKRHRFLLEVQAIRNVREKLAALAIAVEPTTLKRRTVGI